MSELFNENRKLLKIHVVQGIPGSFIMSNNGDTKVFVGTLDQFIDFLRQNKVSDSDTNPRSIRNKTYSEIADDIVSGKNTSFIVWDYKWNIIRDRIHLQEKSASKTLQKNYSYFVSLREIAQRIMKRKQETGSVTPSEQKVLDEVTNFVKQFKNLVEQRDEEIFSKTHVDGKKSSKKVSSETEKIKQNYAKIFSDLFLKSYNTIKPLYEKSKSERKDSSVTNNKKANDKTDFSNKKDIKPDMNKEKKDNKPNNNQNIPKNETKSDLISALKNLGYKTSEINSKISSIKLSGNLESDIKSALRVLKKN